MNKLDFPIMAGARRQRRPEGFAVFAAALCVPAFLLTGCFGDMRGNDVTRPQYVNPLDESPVAAAAETVPQDLPAEQSGASRVRYIQALEGDTARAIAARAGVDPLQVAEMNGIFPDAPLTVGRILAVPADGPAVSPEEISRIASSALGGVETDADSYASGGSGTGQAPGTLLLRDPFANDDGLPQPPVASEPLPEDIENVDLPTSPLFSQYQSEAQEPRFQLPVQGEIIREYSGESGGNEGIDIAAPAGSMVMAAAEGEVAMLSRTSGGTVILLIKHPDNYYTVYSNLTDIVVEKGNRVTRGQNLGAVAGGDKEFLHFEVRIGTESTDPVPYLL